MAAIDTIPAQAGTELLRVLLTVVTAGTDLRISQGNVTAEGELQFPYPAGDTTLADGAPAFDGANPFPVQNGIRLRHTLPTGWIDYRNYLLGLGPMDDYVPRLIVAASNAAGGQADQPIEMTHRNVGSGFWNWIQDDASLFSPMGVGDTLNLVMHINQPNWPTTQTDPGVVLGSDRIGDAYLGSTQVREVRAGDTQVWTNPNVPPPAGTDDVRWRGESVTWRGETVTWR